MWHSYVSQAENASCCNEITLSNDFSGSTPTRFIEEEQESNLKSKIFNIYEPASARNISKKPLTSAAAIFELPKLIGQKQFEFARDVQDYFAKVKKGILLRDSVRLVAQRVSEFLKKEKISADITVVLFSDPEYSDWVEPNIRIEVPVNEVKKTYGVFNELLAFSLKGISKKKAKKLFITIETS